jgi:uridine kinase
MSLKHRLSWFATRGLFVALFLPVVQESLFAQFLGKSPFNFLDPWSDWVDSGGRSDAFPYGPIMLLIQSSVPLLLGFCRLFVDMSNPQTLASILLTALLLLADYFVTKKIISELKAHRHVASIFLFSPLVLFVTYVFGQNDLLPAIALFLACEYILKNKWQSAGIILGLGVCMKFSLFLVLPFIMVYFIGIRTKESFIIFSKVFFPISLLSFIPILWSPGYYEMVIRSPEFVRSLDFAISIGNLQLYLLPIGYFGLLLIFWSLGRMSVLHLVTFISLSMIVISIMQIRSPGWYLWGLLASVFLVSKLRSRILGLFLIWQITTVVAFAYKSELVEFRWGAKLTWASNSTLLSLLFTLNFTLSGLLVYKLLTEANKILDPLSLGKRPLSIGISGDSGVGKDTLSESLSELINSDSISYILGDDYHVAERSSLIWKSKTHLNTSANDLSRFNRDINLAAKKKVVVARHYSHRTGKFTPERLIPPGDFLIVNGLHAIAVPEASKFDLRIFLKMDESLRIALKIQRDVLGRGHSNEANVRSVIKKRNLDSKKFIESQIALADIVLETHLRVEGDLSSIYYKLQAREDILLFELHRTLQALNPDISWIDTNPSGIQSLVLEPMTYTDFYHEAFLNELIPNMTTIVPNPNYSISHSSLLAAITLVVATRQREFLNAS